jgi:hypothetical protein
MPTARRSCRPKVQLRAAGGAGTSLSVADAVHTDGTSGTPAAPKNFGHSVVYAVAARANEHAATLLRPIHPATVAAVGILRQGRQVEMGTRVFVAAVAVALIVSIGAVGTGAARSTAKLPAPLVGPWSRSITAADWARVGIRNEPPARASMLISADGTVVAGETTLRFAPLSGRRLVIIGGYGCGKKKGIYRWTVASGRLTLTKLQDACAYSIAIYAGVWKREKL